MLALYQLRRQYVFLAICIALPTYIGFCTTGYIARSGIIVVIAFCFCLVWLDRPRWRGRLVLTVVACAPFLIVFFDAYQYIRSQQQNQTSGSVVEASSDLLQNELGFPKYWPKVRYSGRNADLMAYWKWLVFLPVPKVLMGGGTAYGVNYEIAEIITGIPAGHTGFTVSLTGPVTESVYIYGPMWFWIHAALTGIAAGVLCGFSGACRSLITVQIQYAIAFGYLFSRAGVGAWAGTVVNTYLGLYLLVIWFLAHRQGARLHRSPTWKEVPLHRPSSGVRRTGDLPYVTRTDAGSCLPNSRGLRPGAGS